MNYAILAVDDDENVIKILKMILSRAGFTIVGTTNPKEALNLLKTHSIDIILLDVIMPEIDGFELLAEIKKDKAFAKTPVIMLTGEKEIKDFQRGHELGVADYINKPFDSRLLVQRINRAIIYTQRTDDKGNILK